MIKFIADSTCDLTDEIITQHKIAIAPLTINIDGKTYRDRIDITCDYFYSEFNNFKTNPTTSMPHPADFLEIVKQAVSDGYRKLICVCMSSGTSASYQSAMVAKQYFMEESPDSEIKFHVVDSKCMSHGSGWLLLNALNLYNKGASYDNLIEFMEKCKTNVKHFLAVDNLDHLIRSGRLSNSSAFLGKLFNLKPIMSMRDGRGAIVAKVKGRHNVIKHYLAEFQARIDEKLTDFVIIGYTSDKSRAVELQTRLKEIFDGEILIMQMGVAVGTHVGLGGLSMFFMEKAKSQAENHSKSFFAWWDKLKS